MFYCGGEVATGLWSIGLAAADHPLGPWRRMSELIPGGGYVTHVFFHDDRWFLYAQQHDQNDYGPTVISTAPTIAGPWQKQTVALPCSTEPWESAGTQGGTGLVINGRHILLYSGAYYVDSERMHAHDSIGVAFSPDGYRFTRSTLTPLVKDKRISIGNVFARKRAIQSFFSIRFA